MQFSADETSRVVAAGIGACQIVHTYTVTKHTAERSSSVLFFVDDAESSLLDMCLEFANCWTMQLPMLLCLLPAACTHHMGEKIESALARVPRWKMTLEA